MRPQDPYWRHDLTMLLASISYILIDVALATIALIIGFGCGWVCFHAHPRESAPSPAPTPTPSGGAAPAPVDLAALERRAAKADMAAQQLRDLTRNVAADVEDHNAKVGDFSSQLGHAMASGDNAVIADAIASMVAANEKLQGRLAEAEKKIQSQAEELRTQESEARTDALTKLANRRAFDAALEDNCAQFAAKGAPFCLMLFDVDHFKKFNDVHGHQTGDEVLRCVARTLVKSAKRTDLACRYGGEEFALIMPGTRIEQAQVAAERIRQAVESQEVLFEGKRLKVTASLGVAEFAVGETPAKLIRRADEAVYAAKNAGRNNAHWHDGVDCLPLNAAKAATAGAKAAPLAAPAPSGSAVPAATAPSAAPSAASPVQIPDRVVFAGELRRRVAESHRFGVSLSVMHLRIKDYERLEATYGQAMATMVLDSVAGFVRSGLRDMDLLAKYDQDEFVVMLPGSSENEAKQVGRRIKSSIAACSIPLGNAEIKLDLHIGVSHVQPDDDAEKLITRARRVMQAAAALDRELAEA